ncbi:unnamed protein product [Heligmosomoides polygyrus]|uniref:Ion_trans_2 domain-containing protein n=1 Tax=Heligmosomoides polygyrus TaxID=6339 RepID=A0A3P8A8F9_HELPZ|nr:unnamed protein product [Heligmosomoides polygyrus]
MLGSAAARRYSCAPAAEDARQRERSPPKSWLGKLDDFALENVYFCSYFQAKFYYDRYNCRYFAPFLLLFIYSLLGAWMFYIVEYENEKEMKMREVKDLERLRHHSFLRFLDLFQNKRRNERPHRSRELLLWYEKELEKVKLPEALEWDMWGALFYVGTIFTTIGYGNIVPRTVTGRALSVVYAIIAILSRFGQFLEHTITRAWLRHRDRFKKAHKSTKKRLSSKTKHGRAISDVEEGKHLPLEPSDAHDDHHMIEDSRTIPIWLALLFCVSWICACAGLFLIWEKRWTFFTSLYFFFISLSTIGLGDVVPDHPHMLILMFWLVIIGLSIVSMLLTVIQIKFEECLYNFMIRMQAEQFERIVRETNNKNIQTEMPTFNGAFTQVENEANSMACDPMSLSDEVLKANGETQWSRQRSSAVNGEHLQRAFDDDDRDSMSDATSLPMDSISCSRNRAPLPKKVAFLGVSRSQDSTGSTSGSLEDESIEVEDIEVQTDIAQFQIDEIVLRLAALQASRAHLEDDDADMETPSLLCTGRRGKRRNRQESEKSVCDMTDNQLLNTIMKVMTSSIEADPIPEKSVKSVETDKQDVVNCAVETDAAMLIDRSMETSRSEAIDAPEKMSWAEKAHRDMMTSPVIRRLLLRTIGTGHSSDDRQADDRSQQTSLSLDHKSTTADRQADDHSQQTSLSIDRKPTTAIDEEMQTSLSIDRARPNIDRALQTTPSIDARPKCDNGSQMSPDVVHRMTAPMSAMSVDCSMQSSSASDAQEKATSRSQQTSVEEININTSNLPELVTTSVGPDEEAEAYHPGTDWNHLGSSSFYDGRMTESMETRLHFFHVCQHENSNLDVPDGYRHHWRNLQEVLPRNFLSGSSLTVARFCSSGMLKLSLLLCRMVSVECHGVLDSILLPFFRGRRRQRHVLQQGSAAVHVSRLTKDWHRHNIQATDWPTSSPDSNPMENTCGIVVRGVYANNRQFNGVVAVLITWDASKEKIIQNLLSSMSNAMHDIIRNNGGPTDF